MVRRVKALLQGSGWRKNRHHRDHRSRKGRKWYRYKLFDGRPKLLEIERKENRKENKYKNYLKI